MPQSVVYDMDVIQFSRTLTLAVGQWIQAQIIMVANVGKPRILK